jgi:hypothetical protein
MRQRQGTILKKCQCANQDRCSHKWTLRYWADGRQRELSFADELSAYPVVLRVTLGHLVGLDCQASTGQHNGTYDRRCRVEPCWIHAALLRGS